MPQINALILTEKIGWTGRSQISSPFNGRVLLQDNALSTFDRLQLGGTTSSFPALQKTGASLRARLADDSANATFQAASCTIDAGGGFEFVTRGQIRAASTGVFTLYA